MKALVLALGVVLLGAGIPNLAERDGAAVYATHCASCHGAGMFGGADGPDLHGAGMATLDFYLTTGRMPAAVGWLQVQHRDPRNGQQLPPAEIAAVERYLASVVGGPAIPIVLAGEDRERGRMLFAANCQQCHGAFGQGGGLGGFLWAPDLFHASITQIAEAVRIGPGEMPQFGEVQIDQTDLDDLAGYVSSLGGRDGSRDLPPFRSGGPIPEGAIGWLGIVVLIVFVFGFWRVQAGPREREDAVRRDAGEGEL